MCRSSTLPANSRMDEQKPKLASDNICCFGVSQVGVPVATVMAHMCPSLRVAVIDLNPEKIMLWNTKQMSNREPKIEEMLKKSQNRNLTFSNNTADNIKNAEIIIILIDCSLSGKGCSEGKILNLKDIENAARIIAKTSESDKIIVLKSTVPVGTNEVVKSILLANQTNNVNFEVLSVPEFFSAGNAISSLLHPDKVLIGSDLSENALKATETLAFLYSYWVPRNRILTMDSKSAELAKFGENAFLAQRLSNVSSFSIICDKSGSDVMDIMRMIGKCSDIGWEYLEPSLGFGGTQLKQDLLYLINLCKDLNLPESADYWNQVLQMNDYHEKKFYRKILSSFFNTLSNKKIAILGLTFRKNLEVTNDSIAFDMCLSLLEEGAKLNLCDPNIEGRQVLNDLRAKGLKDDKMVAYFDDPYKAVKKTHAIILLTDWEEIRSLDYSIVYKNMLRPAYVFDGRRCLPHEDLINIGFVVKTVGKGYSSKTKFEFL